MSQPLRILATAILLLASPWAAATPPQPADNDPVWRERLEHDVRAFHAAIAGSHPGPVDDRNPAFGPLLAEGLERALARAPNTRDYGGYWWALREFQAAFDDGHVQLRATDRAPAPGARWPGILTRQTADGHRIAVRADEAGLPPMAARLLDCDDIAADALADQRLGRFHGNWALPAQRVRHGGRLLVDAGNPWVRPLRTCRFETPAGTIEHPLAWRAIDAGALDDALARTRATHAAGIGLTRRDDGMLWLSMDSFNASSAHPAFSGLTALLADLDDAHGLADAHLVVLDVRGNGGGSSHWSREIARRLWGDAAVAEAAGNAAGSAVDWRVSPANLASIRAFHADLLTQDAPDPELLRWAMRIADGMAAALDRGDTLWRQPDGDDDDAPQAGAPRPRALPADARVHVLTDAACASACLDALDLWLPLGAIHIGGETSADTVYMDVRDETLPSGLSAIAIPMKVYRGRTRGNNVAYVPSHVWTGAAGDQEALAAWIGGLR